MMAEIMCTLSGEQIVRKGFLQAMYEAGMEAVRINTAHLSGAEELSTLAAAVKATNRGIRVLVDTKGPEMRTTATPDNTGIMLCEGDILRIEGCNDDAPTTESLISINHPDLHTVLEPGDTLLIDDGTIRLKIEYVIGNVISARVEQGGILGSHKGVSIDGKDPDLPSVSPRDLEYIRIASRSAAIDVIAHSFVRNAADIMEVKKAMGGVNKPVIAKIENQQGLDNLESITAVADGILIARGDLTATLGAGAVAEAQAKISAVTVGKGLPLYLATGILTSMMDSTTASEKDIEGIKTALDQGVETLLLTNETASGHYPVECVGILRTTVKNHERRNQ